MASTSSSRTIHQLSNGLIVSGPPENPKDRHVTMGKGAAPYTGGDIRKSGELGKMFDIPPLDHTRSSSRSHSGPLPKKTTSGSGSGPLSQIQPTGLITSGPARLSAEQSQSQLQSPAPLRKKAAGEYGSAVTKIREGKGGFGFAIPRVGIWAGIVAFVVGIGVGVFVWVVVGKVVIVAAVAGLLGVVAAVGVWNWGRGRREVERFLREFPETPIDPRNLPVGKYVKVTGLVTCGSIPLETSYQNVPRCVYVSTELHEYRGWNGLPANSNHKRFTWGLRHAEKYVSDFYISDPNSGTRFLVRAGNGAKVVSYVKPATIVDMTKKNREQSPTLLSWLSDHNLSSDNRIMRLEEGYIKEGGSASVMGILRKHENLIMIDPPRDAISTGCQWNRCFFPMYVEGLIMIGDRTPEGEVCLA